MLFYHRNQMNEQLHRTYLKKLGEEFHFPRNPCATSEKHKGDSYYTKEEEKRNGTKEKR